MSTVIWHSLQHGIKISLWPSYINAHVQALVINYYRGIFSTGKVEYANYKAKHFHCTKTVLVSPTKTSKICTFQHYPSMSHCIKHSYTKLCGWYGETLPEEEGKLKNKGGLEIFLFYLAISESGYWFRPKNRNKKELPESYKYNLLFRHATNIP